jgi:hypothetical protein
MTEFIQMLRTEDHTRKKKILTMMPSPFAIESNGVYDFTDAANEASTIYDLPSKSVTYV